MNINSTGLFRIHVVTTAPLHLNCTHTHTHTHTPVIFIFPFLLNATKTHRASSFRHLDLYFPKGAMLSKTGLQKNDVFIGKKRISIFFFWALHLGWDGNLCIWMLWTLPEVLCANTKQDGGVRETYSKWKVKTSAHSSLLQTQTIYFFSHADPTSPEQETGHTHTHTQNNNVVENNNTHTHL